MIATALLLALAAPTADACPIPPPMKSGEARPRQHAFQNGGGEPLTLAWLNQEDQPVAIGAIEAGGSRLVDTYVGHVFTLSDAQGRCQRIVRIDDVLSGTYTGASRYRPVAVRHGWPVFADQALDLKRDSGRAAVRLIARMLSEMERALPPAALAQLRTTPIFLHDYTGAGAVFHRDPDWLIAHGRTVELLNAVELANMALFVRDSSVQPGTLLHELTQRYQLSLPPERQAEIDAAYRHAMAAGLYRNVRRHTGSYGPAYAQENAAEYLAELTEAYFSRNDFFPFTRAELAAHDPEGARLVERLWGVAP